MVLSFPSFLDSWDLAIFVTPRQRRRQMPKANLSTSARKCCSHTRSLQNYTDQLKTRMASCSRTTGESRVVLSLSFLRADPDASNLLDTDKLKEYLNQEAHRHINTDSDSEIMLQVLASQLLQTDKRRVDADDIFTGLEKMCVATRFQLIPGAPSMTRASGLVLLMKTRD